MECSICFDEIGVARATLACAHNFHILCLTKWFYNQNMSSDFEDEDIRQHRTFSSCPCCRSTATGLDDIPFHDMARFSEDDDDEEDSDEEDEDEDDGPQVLLSREDVNTFLTGAGQPQSTFTEDQWMEAFVHATEPAEVGPNNTIRFSRDELDCLLGDEVPLMSDETWDALLANHRSDDPVPAEEEAPAPAAAAEQPFVRQIHWSLQPNGRWARIEILLVHPETVASAPQPPPVLPEVEAARKLQAVWRGFVARRLVRSLRSN